MAVDDALLEFFTAHYKPGLIGLVGTKDAVGLAIRDAQRAITSDHSPSLWSHCFIMGDLRLDRHGPGKSVTKSPYLFESDLKINFFEPQVRNGAQENWIGKWSDSKVENAAAIDFGLADDQLHQVLATALELVDEQVLYPIQELMGTWFSIITKKQWQENPMNDPHATYCSGFVRYCYKEAGRDFLGNDIPITNTTPEDVAHAGLAAKAITIFKT
ncbi:MAG: hypothetical protein ACLQF0_00235 [Dissulfurispiraceae bacterium]